MIHTLFVTGMLFLISFQSFSKVPDRSDVVIVGAGLSGLTTAYELKKAGIKYHILELTPHIGGRVRTVTYKMNGETLLADSGMEEYWESNPAVKIIKELKLPLREDVAMSSIVLEGKKNEFIEDTQPQYVAKLFNEEERKALETFKKTVSELIPKIVKEPIDIETLKLKDISFEDWVKKQNLPKKVAEWIRISVECEAGTEWNAFGALDAIEELAIFLGDGERSFRIINGNEIFTNALTKKIGRENISTNQRVTKITTKDDVVTINYLDVTTNQSKTIKASHVVTTIPLFRLNMEVQISPSMSEKKLEAISTQTYGSYFKAHIFVPSSASTFWNKNGDSILPFLTDSELGVIYDGNPDQKTKIKIVSLLITGERAEGFNFMNQDQVREILKRSFERFWPGFSKEIIGMEFYRYHPRAIAGWPVGRSRFDELSNEIRRPENRLYLAGDFTEGTHSSGAINAAFRVVKQIKDAKKNKK